MNVELFKIILEKCGVDYSHFNDGCLNSDLVIDDKVSLQELYELDQITSINGNLVIESSSLVDISCFNQLQSVNSVLIRNCNELIAISGFSTLDKLNSIEINNNILLRQIAGFRKLFSVNNSVEGVIKVTGNNALKDVDFLKGLKLTRSSLYLHHNGIDCLYGLSDLEYVGASLSLSSNNIQSLKELSSLKRVNGMLGVVNNNLKNLKGLENLESLKTISWNSSERTLALHQNPLLKDISSISNVKVDGRFIIICDDIYEELPPHESSFYENFTELCSSDYSEKYYLGEKISEDDYSHDIDKASFEEYSNKARIGNYFTLRECKFILADIDSEQPELFWINTKKFKYHYLFFKNVLDNDISLAEFDRMTYFAEDKKNISGTLTYHDDGLTSENLHYGINFWPSDEISADYIRLCYDKIHQHFKSISNDCFVHVSGSYIEQQINNVACKNIPVVYTDEIFNSISFISMNSGVSYGVLRFPEDSINVSPEDIVVLKEIPNHISHVAGIITSVPQTPLSHVNLIAKQNNIPNCYVESAHVKSSFVALKDKYVKLEVTDAGCYISECLYNSVNKMVDDDYLILPDKYNLSDRNINYISEISLDNNSAYGAKSSNLGEVYSVLGEEYTPNAFAIPFSYYYEFMVYNGLYEFIRDMMVEYHKLSHVSLKTEIVNIIKKRIRKGCLPGWMHMQLDELMNKYPEGTILRFRSSASNEDMIDFNGAGLYDSYSHKKVSEPVEKTIKKVWASVWNYRAIEERAFHKVSHFDSLMGICVHPRYREEKANGVAVTKNIFNEKEKGFYINAQIGESLITNPDSETVPEEIIVYSSPSGYITQYVRNSNRVADGQRVIDREKLNLLLTLLSRLDRHYKSIYNEQFALEVEFKIDVNDDLHIKQARPWVSAVV